jgi:CO/xanthine dehydrogenase Mo-binding subunit
VDDMQLPGMLHMACLRSPHPHARILSMQRRVAQAMPGVVAVVTGEELSERLHIPVLPMVPGMQVPPHPLLARGVVHAAGVPVAAVVAHSRALAYDAVNAMTVEYAALPAVVQGTPTRRAAGPRRAGEQHLLHNDKNRR